MKTFIYFCCIAHLLPDISARLRLTTPMPSARRKNNDMAKQISNVAEMIDFVNSAFNHDDGRSVARRGRYDLMLRRFEDLPAVKTIHLPQSIVVPNEEDTENQADTVRYQVIDNPEVLEEYSNKQIEKNNKKLLKPALVSDTSPEAKSFSTVDKKLNYYHSKSKTHRNNNNNNNDNSFDEFLHTPQPNPLDDVQEPTTVEPTYKPSFPDDDNDDDADEKPINDDIEVSVTEKEISTPRVNEKNHNDLNINTTIKIEATTLDNKASGMEDQAGIEEEKASTDNTKDTGQMKHELPLMKDKNNDDDIVTVGVTVNEEKSGGNKVYISSKLDNNSNEKPIEDNVRPRDEDYKNDANINVTTDTNSDKNPKKRSLNTKKVISVPVDERFMGKMSKSALRTEQKNNNNEYKEQHSIYSHKKRNENSSKENSSSKSEHETRDEDDRKKEDKNDERLSKKENDWNKMVKQRYNKGNGEDRMEYEWNNRHQQYDENDNWNINPNNAEKQWDKNDDLDSRDRDSNKRDNDWDEIDNDWKKKDNDWKKKDNDWKDRDNDWYKRDTEWNKRDNEWINEDKTHKDDQNKNDVGRKQNDWDSKYSHTSVENEGVIAQERFEIIERKFKDGDANRHSEV